MRLGELEKLVMNYLWREHEADAKQVHRYFGPRRGGSLNTIQSTLDRLFKKRLLARTKNSHAFIYAPAVKRKVLLSSLIKEITEELAKNDADAVLEAFVDVSVGLDEKSLQRLEHLIASKRAEGEDKGKKRP